MTQKPTKAMLDALDSLISQIRGVYGQIPVLTHRDLRNTKCPGDNIWNHIQLWYNKS